MDEANHFQLRLTRTPHRLDLGEVVAVRDAVRAEIDAALEALRALPSAIRLLSPGVQEEALLDHVLGPDLAPSVAAFMREARLRPGVVRCFRVGEVVFDGSQGRQRVAAAVEWMDDERWWAAWRSISEAGATWNEAAGRGLADLVSELRPWFDAGDARVESIGEREVEGPDIRAAVMPMDQPLPETLEELASALAPEVDALAVQGRLDGLLVLAFRERTLERWELRGNLPCAVEDLVRAIAIQEPVRAVAVGWMGRVKLGEAVHSALLLQLERPGDRGVRVLPLAHGAREPLTPLWQDLGDPGERAWIGRPPSVDIALTPLGPVGLAPAEIAEG